MTYSTLSKRPFLIPAVAMICGIGVGRVLDSNSLLFITLLLIGLCIPIILKLTTIWRHVGLFILFGCFGLFLAHSARIDLVALDKLERKEKFYLGVEQVKYKKNHTEIIASLVSDEIKSNVLIRLKGSCETRFEEYGLIELNSRLRKPGHEKQPNGFNYYSYLLNKNIQFISYAECHDVIGMTKGQNAILRASLFFNHKLLNRLDDVFEQSNSKPLIKGILLGEKSEMEKSERTLYSMAGIGHVFAVSGMHVGMVYLVLLPFLFFRHRNALTKLMIPVIALCLVWVFIMSAGLTPSAVRAGLMISMYEIGNISYRRIDKWNMLSLTAIISVCFNPLVIYDIGFQFSYLALSGIFFFFGRISKLFNIKNVVLKTVCNMIVLSVSAQLTLLPLSLYYFGSFSPYFWLSSLLAMLIVQINFVLSILALLIGDWTVFAEWAIHIIDYLFDFLLVGIEFVMSWPVAVVRWSPTVVDVSLCYQLLIFLGVVILSRNKRKAISVSALVMSFVMLGVLLNDHRPKKTQLFIYSQDGVHVALEKMNLVQSWNILEFFAYDDVVRIGDKTIAFWNGEDSVIPKEMDIIVVNSDMSLSNINSIRDARQIVVSKTVSWKAINQLRRWCEIEQIPFYQLREGVYKELL